MTTEITAVLKRHPSWYGKRPDWVFTYNRESQSFRHLTSKGSVYELRIGSLVRGIWIRKILASRDPDLPPWYSVENITQKVFAKSLHFADGGKFVFPKPKASK